MRHTADTMCCQEDERLDLPPAIIEMIARYRRMRAEQGFGWGEDALPDFFRWARFSRLGPAFDQLAATGDWAAAVRAAVGDEIPPGLVLVTLADDAFTARTGPPRPVISGGPAQVDVVLDAAAAAAATVVVNGHQAHVPAGGAGLVTLDLDADRTVIDTALTDTALTDTALIDTGDGVPPGRTARVTDAVVAVPAATLRLNSPAGARWSVTDASGGAWFAEGVPRKWDAADRPFFHADPGTTELTVPAGALHVEAARGLEFERLATDLDLAADEVGDVTYDPARRFDPVAAGWYGADLHVHLNYSGDHVLHPADARRMQVGEGLHLMVLTAGNLGGPLIYDLEVLEATAGTDLWSVPDLPSTGGGAGPVVARAGLEFRNAMLGHVHGLGLTGVPELRTTGDEGTDHPWDSPPNEVACRQMRDLGAVTTYAHPVFAAGDDPHDLFRPFRMVEARELVADAALGVVDAVELVSCFDDHGAQVLYHHLLSCGLRLAATAGTDTFLSFAHGPVPASNPPGWGRVYAQLGEGALTVESFSAAVRAGRTLVTNGPWLTLEVDGHGPGTRLERRAGDRVRVRASVTGSGVDRLVLYGPDGELASTPGALLEHEMVPDDGVWLAAAAHGGQDDPHTVGAPVFAHTSPVWVDVEGRGVARAASARWCLALLDGVHELATEHGRFDPHEHDRQLGDLDDVLDRARTYYRAVADGSR